MKNFLLWVVLASLFSISLDAQSQGLPLTDNILMDFYGRVVDQNGTPIAHAKIKLQFDVQYMFSPSQGGMKFEHLDVESDEHEDWSVTNANGYAIKVLSISKDGYEMSRLIRTLFAYRSTTEPFHAEAGHPVVFVLWEKGKKTRLISYKNNCDVIADGRAYAIDLEGRQVTEATNSENDLELRLIRPAGVGKHDKFDWTVSVRARHGNLLVPVDENYDQMAILPSEGYSASYEETHRTSDPFWRPLTRKNFYLKLNNGRSAARIEILWDAIPTAHPQARLGGMVIKYTVNPNGLALTQ